MKSIELGEQFKVDGFDGVFRLTEVQEVIYTPPGPEVYLFGERLDVSHLQMKEKWLTMKADMVAE